MDGLAVNLLKTDDQHRPVGLPQDRVADLYDVVRADSEEESVEGRVVKLAQRDPVTDDRITLWIVIRCDVRGVEQLVMAQPTQGAPVVVRTNDTRV